MPRPRSPEATRIVKLSEVGRYALGVDWGDGHESILPFRALRAACPCDACAGAPRDTTGPAEGDRLARVETLGEASVFLRWTDGHETLLMVDEMRDLCRCARCVGEPDHPISGV
jgi:DUF971 family protein